MSKTKYEQSAHPDPEEKQWTRYGLTEDAWNALSIDERITHYHRQDVCAHAYVYPGIETGKGVFDLNDKRLEDQYSHDPYFHSTHIYPCRMKDDPKCDCQMCANKIGQMRVKAVGL